jgi:peptidyl-prolyl cis-trans isomerase D
MERYRQLLGAQGMSPRCSKPTCAPTCRTAGDGGCRRQRFCSQFAADIALERLLRKARDSAGPLQRRRLRRQAEPDGRRTRAVLQGEQKLFQAPEQASIEYLVLDLDGVGKKTSVNEADLKTYYEQNSQRSPKVSGAPATS